MSSLSMMKHIHRSPLVLQGAPLACLGGLLFTPVYFYLPSPADCLQQLHLKSCDYKWVRGLEQALLLGKVWRNLSGYWLAKASISGSFIVPWNSGERRVKTTGAVPLPDGEGMPQLSSKLELQSDFLCVGIRWGACWKCRFLGLPKIQ